MPVQLSELTPADLKNLREAEEALASADLAEAEKLLASDPAVVRWLGVFASPLAGASLLGAAGALGLFVYSQVLTILGFHHKFYVGITAHGKNYTFPENFMIVCYCNFNLIHTLGIAQNYVKENSLYTIIQ